MFGVYKGKRYELVRGRKHWELLSRDPECLSDGFLRNGSDTYFKPVLRLNELDEAFDVKLVVEYDTHHIDVPTEWVIRLREGCLEGSLVKLEYFDGIILGWDVEPKAGCSKYVPLWEIKSAYVETIDLIAKATTHTEIPDGGRGFAAVWKEYACGLT